MERFVGNLPYAVRLEAFCALFGDEVRSERSARLSHDHRIERDAAAALLEDRQRIDFDFAYF